MCLVEVEESGEDGGQQDGVEPGRVAPPLGALADHGRPFVLVFEKESELGPWPAKEVVLVA